jgi:hypothetical protein
MSVGGYMGADGVLRSGGWKHLMKASIGGVVGSECGECELPGTTWFGSPSGRGAGARTVVQERRRGWRSIALPRAGAMRSARGIESLRAAAGRRWRQHIRGPARRTRRWRIHTGAPLSPRRYCAKCYDPLICARLRALAPVAVAPVLSALPCRTVAV